MIVLVAGLIVFFGVHSIAIVAAPLRDRLAARLGAGPWKALYGVVALAGFVLMVKGYAAARLDPTIVYVPPAGLRSVTFALMLPVFPLLLATYLPGRIKAKVKNPMLTATKLWALAHLFANGTLADLALFGAFLIWAVADVIAIKRRAPRPAPALPARAANDAIAVAGGLALYVAFIVWLHPLLIGVAVAG